MQSVQVRAAGGPEVLEVTQSSVPDPGAGEVRIAVKAAGVNQADAAKRRGEYPDGPTPPYVPGIEVAGIVDAVGAEVERRVGDTVLALPTGGGYAEYVVVHETRLLPAPAGYDPEELAAIPVQFLTAHNVCFEWPGMKPDDHVLVTGAAGGVGRAIVQLAAGAGATVYGVASTERKREIAAECGSRETFAYEAIPDRPLAATNGAGVNLFLDGVGGGAFDAGLDALAAGATAVSYGLASGRVATVATPRLLFRNRRLVGYHLEEALERVPGRVRRALPSLLSAFNRGDLEVRIDGRFSLSDAAAAHRRLAQRDRVGKVVLLP